MTNPLEPRVKALVARLDASVLTAGESIDLFWLLLKEMQHWSQFLCDEEYAEAVATLNRVLLAAGKRVQFTPEEQVRWKNLAGAVPTDPWQLTNHFADVQSFFVAYQAV